MSSNVMFVNLDVFANVAPMDVLPSSFEFPSGTKPARGRGCRQVSASATANLVFVMFVGV